jgi:hypothetical protein
MSRAREVSKIAVSLEGINFNELISDIEFIDAENIINTASAGVLETISSIYATIENVNNLDTFPSQTSQSGKYLTTDGTDTSWASVDALPSQSGNSGKYLTTDGTNPSWNTLDLSTKADTLLSINNQTASYTLILEDLGKLVEINTSSANNLTIPLESSVNFPIGSQIYIIQTGTGQTTIVPTGGVTLSGTPGLKLRAQNSGAQLVKKSSNNWVAIGDLVS